MKQIEGLEVQAAVTTFIIWAIVMIAIVSQIKKKVSQEGNSTGRDLQNNQRNLMETRLPVGGRIWNQGVNTASGKKSNPILENARMTPGNSKATTGNTQTMDENTQDFSTTAYLEEKARQDQQNHSVEKMRERQEDLARRGGASVGIRLYEGDSIPSGMRPVKCSYCAADNLLPVNAHGKYTCYFCREEL